ncbi:ABC-type amino acid transport substrate-binding protein [Bradyrhizobium sp. LM3.2]
MPTSLQSALAGLVLAAAVAMPALADGLKDDIAPSGKLRVAIAISPAGGAFWSTKTEAGYAGVPVDLGKEMAAQLGVPVEYVVHQNSGQITDAASKSTLEKGAWDVTWLPKDPERETRMMFGPIYEVADATYIVKAGSSVTDFATLDQVGIKVAAVNATTTMRGAVAHLKNAKVTGYQTYDEIRSASSAAARSTPSRCRATSSTRWRRRSRARRCWTRPSRRRSPRSPCRSATARHWLSSPSS